MKDHDIKCVITIETKIIILFVSVEVEISEPFYQLKRIIIDLWSIM